MVLKENKKISLTKRLVNGLCWQAFWLGFIGLLDDRSSSLVKAKYGRQIFEAISYANEFPVVKEKLLIMFDKLIDELSELIDEDELNDYKKAKEVVEKIPENEVEELCFTVESLYGDVENYPSYF